jgi:coenzyme F420-0:L-glutamate ligase
MTAGGICVTAVRWPEISPEDDLSSLVRSTTNLQDGDIVVLTSKVVSKAAGRVHPGARADWVSRETSRVVARRGETVIAQTRQGLVLAAAGVDASNTAPDTVVLLPEDADQAARELRRRIAADAGRNVAVVVTDTAGRAWRIGQTDIAIGCAGLQPVADLRGTADTFGRRLDVTMPAIADEVAAAGDLVKGKATGCPLAVVRGLDGAVLPSGEDGPGATELVRDSDADLFGLGTREAARAAVLRDDPDALRAFPALGVGEDVPFESVALPDVPAVAVTVRRFGVGSQSAWLLQTDVRASGNAESWFAAGRVVERSRALAAAHRLVGAAAPDLAQARRGWRTADCTRWSIA